MCIEGLKYTPENNYVLCISVCRVDKSSSELVVSMISGGALSVHVTGENEEREHVLVYGKNTCSDTITFMEYLSRDRHLNQARVAS